MVLRFFSYELDFNPTVAAVRASWATPLRHRLARIDRPLVAAASASLIVLTALAAPAAGSGDGESELAAAPALPATKGGDNCDTVAGHPTSNLYTDTALACRSRAFPPYRNRRLQ